MTSAKVDCFLDTNILIYAAAGKTNDPRRFQIAYRLVLESNFGISSQTLAEFCSVVLRKKMLQPDAIQEWLHYLGELPLVPVDQAYVILGLAYAQRYKLAYYDAALLGAAERLGAKVFYTEDLSHDQFYGSIRAINPFLQN